MENDVCDKSHNFDNYIDQFIHCGLCVKERPETLSPREYAHNEVGILRNGDIQVWCIRHEKNVVIFDFETRQLHTDPDADPKDIEDFAECSQCQAELEEE